MTFYSILAVTPTNSDWVEDYLPIANRLVAKHGGEYLARTKQHQQLEGSEQSAALRIIIRWPSQQAAEAFMADPEYLPQLQARTAGSQSQHFLLAGIDELAAL